MSWENIQSWAAVTYITRHACLILNKSYSLHLCKLDTSLVANKQAQAEMLNFLVEDFESEFGDYNDPTISDMKQPSP